MNEKILLFLAIWFSMWLGVVIKVKLRLAEEVPFWIYALWSLMMTTSIFLLLDISKEMIALSFLQS